ncbi:uncharacterized protein LOC115441890 [Manduca sexta]|uniref:Uncharacterized protein n=1 Tax=Manduca sexta TaxID=7130 RepID=A0A922CIQ0_MANSE|nr:uncharacterized protein LOC115441890 [Manduca sexta]KAG6447592.1 hypothetical protein O3G_MSEX005072 [Manduca sexta]
MLHFVVLNLILLSLVESVPDNRDDSGEVRDIDAGLLSNLRNDANLDLSVDEEYEDLRAELLAYHTAFASLASQPDTRRSMMTTPCWTLGGICINYRLCTGYRFLTEVPGCKDKLNVCCFTWNRFHVKDMTHKGISNLAMPWSVQQDFGGEGIKEVSKPTKKKKSKKRVKPDAKKTLALIISK